MLSAREAFVCAQSKFLTNATARSRSILGVRLTPNAVLFFDPDGSRADSDRHRKDHQRRARSHAIHV
jgi:hypothetical protein